jgi:hypothetical protein
MIFHDECMADLTLNVRPKDTILYAIEHPTGDGVFNALLSDPGNVYAVSNTREQLRAFKDLLTMVTRDTFVNLWKRYARVSSGLGLFRFLYLKPNVTLQKQAWHRYKYITKCMIWCITSHWLFFRHLGICDQQLALIANDGRTLFDYVWTVLDGVVQHTNLNENVHYFALLNGSYTRDICPVVLNETYFEIFKTRATNIRLRRGLKQTLMTIREDLNRVMLLDHLDRLDEPEVSSIISLLHRRMSPDGVGLFRSVSLRPWFVDTFEQQGFKIFINASHSTDAIVDFTNAFASFWTFKPIKGCKAE